MYTQNNKKTLIEKAKYFWFVNLILFAGVVFLGIEQAGRGAEISQLEDKIEAAVSVKRDLAENVFNSSSEDKIAQNSLDLGFNKPTSVYYFKTEDVFARLPVR